MKDIIIKNIKETIDDYKDEFEIYDVHSCIMICDAIDDALHADYCNGVIPTRVRVAAILQKWIDDEDRLGISSADADGWDDAEELVIYLAIERPRPRKDKKLHEEIIKDCMPLLVSLVPMQNFVETYDEGVSQFGGGDYFPHESVGFFNFYKQNYYDNHKKFHRIV